MIKLKIATCWKCYDQHQSSSSERAPACCAFSHYSASDSHNCFGCLFRHQEILQKCSTAQETINISIFTYAKTVIMMDTLLFYCTWKRASLIFCSSDRPVITVLVEDRGWIRTTFFISLRYKLSCSLRSSLQRGGCDWFSWKIVKQVCRRINRY